MSAARAEFRNVGVIGTDEAVETSISVKGSVFETINFDVASPSVLSGSGVNSFLKLGSKTVTGISGLTLTF